MARVPMRSSLRSRDSSSTSTGADPRERIKDCCRKLVAFMCTQVGVGGLVVGYAIVGAFGFMTIETRQEYSHLAEVDKLRNISAKELWIKTAADPEVNVLNKTAFDLRTKLILKKFQENFTLAVKRGYDGRKAIEVWSFPAALMFCLSIFTMIGYGNMVPRTSWGKGTTVMYAVFGIPLWLYRWIHECSGKQRTGPRIIVPSTACLWVIFGYIAAGAIMFAEWEGWNYLDSAYFCVTSLCKIGIGDFVPGANILESKSGSQTKLVINFVYLLLGMGLIAMCYNLMREDVRVKARELREDLREALEDIRIKMLTCCRGNPD
ncbi:two pore potassium channel protein sup-9 isoform X2 [Cephus cinctus]|uniref:Two pore potassium channel protein sup-9 isoform X2 n=1 Tax=Cephus cinctus TaxID=211228 RepID=A0AAJ7VZV5_CEPCN|nr:two pore potassium channel protein sup-9 isoform X2 [Cephus cinctus]